MNGIRLLRIVSNILGLVIIMPIWFYLVYQLLKAAEVSDLTRFLFWIYVPVALLVGVLQKIVDAYGFDTAVAILKKQILDATMKR